MSKNSFNQGNKYLWKNNLKTKPHNKNQDILANEEHLLSRHQIHEHIFLELEFRSKILVLKLI